MTNSGRHRCVLIRHGETEWSLDGRHTGRTDLPLLAEGEVQARALAEIMACYSFAAVLTSPLRRARDTTVLAGLGGAELEPDLAEWDYGAYDGVTTDQIRAVRPAWDIFDDGALEGETAAEVGKRVDRVIERVRAVDGDVVCVAHAHVLRVLGARWVGLPAAEGRCLTMRPASFSELGWERENPVIMQWNVR